MSEVELFFERPSYVRRFVLNAKNLCRSAERVVAYVMLGMIPGFAIAFILSDGDGVPFASSFAIGLVIAPVAIVGTAALRASAPPPTLHSVTFRERDLLMKPETGAGYVAPWDWVLGAEETGEGIWLDVMSFEGYLPGLRRDTAPSVLVNRGRFSPEQLAWLLRQLEERGCRRRHVTSGARP